MIERTSHNGKKSRKFGGFLIGACVIAVIGFGGWALYARNNTTKFLKAYFESRHIQYEAMHIDWRGHYRLTNVKAAFVNTDDVSIAEISGTVDSSGKIGALDAKDIRLDLGIVNIKVPVFKAEAVRIASDGIEERVKKFGYTPFFAGLLGDEFARISMNELVFEQDVSGVGQEIHYSDITFEGIKDGAIGYMTIASMQQKVTYDQLSLEDHEVPSLDMTTGRLKVQDINMNALAELYLAKTRPNTKDDSYRMLYGAYSIKDIKYQFLAGQDASIDLKAGSFEGDGVSLKPLSFSFIDFCQKMQNLSKEGHLSIQDLAQINNYAMEMLESFGPIKASMTDFVYQLPKENVLKINKLQFGFDGTAADIEFKDFWITGTDGKMGFSNLSFSGLTFPELLPLVRELHAAMVKVPPISPPADLEQRAAMAMVPHFKRIHLQNFQIDIPEYGSGDEPRAFFIVPDLDITARHGAGPVPTALKIAMQESVISNTLLKDVDAPGGMQLGRMLKDLDYGDRIHVAFNLDGAWNKEDSSFVLDDLTLAVKDMGALHVELKLASVFEGMFGNDFGMLRVSAMASRIAKFGFQIEGDEIAKRIFSKMAADTGKSVEQIREETAQTAVQSVLAANDEESHLLPIATVFGECVRKGGTLAFDVQSKRSGGVGVFELGYAFLTPGAFLDLFDFNATRNEGTKK